MCNPCDPAPWWFALFMFALFTGPPPFSLFAWMIMVEAAKWKGPIAELEHRSYYYIHEPDLDKAPTRFHWWFWVFLFFWWVTFTVMWYRQLRWMWREEQKRIEEGADADVLLPP